MTGGSFDLRRCGRARLVGGTSAAAEKILNEFPGLLQEKSGVALQRQVSQFCWGSFLTENPAPLSIMSVRLI